MLNKFDPRLGYIRVGVMAPKQRPADAFYNASEILAQLRPAQRKGVDLLVGPEMGLVTYDIRDLLHQFPLIKGAKGAFQLVVEGTRNFDGLLVVGLPLLIDGALYNCAAFIKGGQILGIVPKTYLPNGANFQDPRFFASGAANMRDEIVIAGKRVPFGTDLLFECTNVEGFILGVDVCEDGWVPIPPSAFQVLAGATVIVNPSASNASIAKADYRRMLFRSRSASYISAYLYAPSGVYESTTDVVYDGQLMIFENGCLLAEGKRFERDSSKLLLMTDIDLERLLMDRMRTGSFHENKRVVFKEHPNGAGAPKFRRITFALKELKHPRKLMRFIDGHPFVPADAATLNERCEEVFATTSTGLAQRLMQVGSAVHQLYGSGPRQGAEPTAEHLSKQKVVIGMSGGKDSTLAGISTTMAFDLLRLPRGNIIGYWLNGFGSTPESKELSMSTMRLLGMTIREHDIRLESFLQMRDDGHKPFGIDLTALEAEAAALSAPEKASLLPNGGNADDLKIALFEERLRLLPKGVQDTHFENSQARARTKVLMQNGFVIGTGTLSELAKGYCTFNADHMAMYNPNVDVAKTQVISLIRWAAANKFDGELREVLLKVADATISAELLPRNKDGEIQQKTEDVIGPYELTDFYLFFLLRFGFEPEKIMNLAEHAEFNKAYSENELRHWMIDFIERFFRSQFKRSTLPDGPKVGSISLSPRGDWRMPSDACAALWLNWLDEQERAERIAAHTR